MTTTASSSDWTSLYNGLDPTPSSFPSDLPTSIVSSNPISIPSTTPTFLPSGVIDGTPDQDAAQWIGKQIDPMGCAIRCQEAIIKQYTGQDIGETQLESEAKANGWFTEANGTPFKDVGLEMQLHGVPMHQASGATVYDLANELTQDHKVIVAVDAGALEQGTPNGSGHAVEVTGIDTTDLSNPQVIVNDPGIDGGAENHYSMSQFMQAWGAGNNYMVATDAAPPSQLPTHTDPFGTPLPTDHINPFSVPACSTNLDSGTNSMSWAQQDMQNVEHWGHDVYSHVADDVASFAHF